MDESQTRSPAEIVASLSVMARNVLAVQHNQAELEASLFEYVQTFESALRSGFLQDFSGERNETGNSASAALQPNLEELAALHAGIVEVAERVRSQISLDMREFRQKSRGLLAYSLKPKSPAPVMTSKKR